MTEEQKNNLREWIAALRSGEYNQATGMLFQPVTNCYCCLGVACKVQKVKLVTESTYGAGFVFEEHEESQEEAIYVDTPDDEWFLEKFGFKVGHSFNLKSENDDTFQDELVGINDDRDYSFEQIAELLEEEFLK